MADDCLGGFEALEQRVERGVVVALRQAPVTLAHHQRHMGILRMRQPKQILQIALLWARAQQIHAAHHAIHALLAIVDHHSQLIRERLVASANKEVTAITRKVLLEMALNQIVDCDGFIGYNKPHRGLTHCRLFCTLFSTQSTARARIHEFLAMVRRRSRMQIGARAKTRVHQAALNKRVERRLVSFVTVMLKIRTFVPCKAQRLEIALNSVDELGLRTLAVQIFHAKYHGAALRLRHKPCHKRRENIARVHAARGRRRKTAFDMYVVVFHVLQNSTRRRAIRIRHALEKIAYSAAQ